MTFTPEQVEKIVLEVIRRLGALDANPMRQRGTDGPCDLTLNEKVITLRLLENRLAGVQRLVVVGKAVVTPAVLDELRDREIELVRKG